MNTQEAQTLVNNWKGSKDDPKYLEAKDFLENQQKEGEKAEKKKSLKGKLVMTPEEMQKMTSERQDVKTGARRSMVANPAVGVVDRVMGNVTGRNEDLFDPLAFKDKDLNADGSIKEKDLQVGNGTSGNFIGAEEEKTGNGGSSDGSGSSNTGLDKHTQNYLDKNDKIAETVEEKQLKRLLEHSDANWKQMTDTSAKVRNAYNDIDDKYIEQLPTFMFRRYQNGEFGDPKSGDAKLRLAHFMINGVGTALANASHIIRKDGVQEQSDYEKVQGTNLEQGLANRWKKNNAETEEVIKIANKEADNEQDARIYVEQLTRDNMLKSGWNAMDQNQKLYAINVSREIGKMIGDMNVEELSNFITAQALNGNLSEQQAVVVGLASLVSKTPELLQKMPEGGIRDAVMSLLGIGK